jgi:hypothetical protein
MKVPGSMNNQLVRTYCQNRAAVNPKRQLPRLNGTAGESHTPQDTRCTGEEKVERRPQVGGVIAADLMCVA